MALNEDLQKFLQKIFDKVVQETQDVLSTIINRQCQLSVSDLKEFELEEVVSSCPDPVLLVEFVPVKDPEGKVKILVQKELATKVSSWMMMMDEILEFNEETIDSIQETANQVLGTLTTSLAEIAGGNVEFKDIKASEATVDDSIFSESELMQAKFTLNIEEDQEYTVYLVMTLSTPTKFMDDVFAMDMDIDDQGADIDALMSDGSEPSEADSVTEEGGEEDKGGDEGDDSGMGDILGDLGDLGDIGGDDKATAGGAPGVVPAAPAEPSYEDLGVDKNKIEILMDLSLPVSIELGRTKMMIKDILELGHGSVIEFDKLAGEPVDLLINDKKIAEGEVVVIDEHFGIRVTNLVKPSERIKKLGE